MLSICLGILVIGGALIDESQDEKCIRKSPCSKAREIFVLKWLVVGFLLTTMYKSVLRSNMIHIKYERGIDSVEDVLKTDKKVLFTCGSPGARLVSIDRREKMKKFHKRVECYHKNYRTSTPPWVAEGRVPSVSMR